jgi:hypothetical protein
METYGRGAWRGGGGYGSKIKCGPLPIVYLLYGWFPSTGYYYTRVFTANPPGGADGGRIIH